MAHVKLTKAYSHFGASMGRPAFGGPSDEPGRGTLDQIPLQGDYDNGGAYWGVGEPLYRFNMVDAEDEPTATRWFRANSRAQAEQHVRNEFPNVVFVESDAAPDEFVNAYCKTMLWSTGGMAPKCPDLDCEECKDGDCCTKREEYESLEDFEPADETIEQARAECDQFWAKAKELISAETFLRGSDYVSRAGHDFWLTRNGHGAGFWDGDWREPEATKLTELCKSFGERWLYVGDDDLVYFS